MQINGTSVGSGYNASQRAEEQKTQQEKALQNISAVRALSGIDGANLAIADSLLSQSNTLEQGIANANDAIGMLNIADSTLSNLSQSANRINELSVSLGSAALNSDQRSMIQKEISSLSHSMSQSVQNATFNGKSVFGSELNFVTGEGVQSINLSTESITNVAVDGSNANDIRQNINSLRTNIGSAQNGIAAGINASIAQSIALRQSESGLQNNDIAKNVNDLQQANLNIDASILAQVHNISNLQSQMDRLLA
ncbi:flagellin [Campylobacter curvus]|uniref:flagellin n=1 Tax=Campylobacter curvus TaxID=200 RepID=UPI000367A3B3|nr:flagellin [Campylobacter curvus]QKF61077.1 flagellar secreted protein [Campylobacter curvus]UEB49396.1 flagellin [Campylobacter curvus]